MEKIVNDIVEYAEENNIPINSLLREIEKEVIFKYIMKRTKPRDEGKVVMMSTPSSPSGREVFMSMYDDVEDNYIHINKSSAIGITEDDCIDICELKMICSDEEEYFERILRARENSYYVQNKVPKHLTKQSQRFNKKPTNNPIAGRSY